jgi:TonB family protein
LKGPQKIPPPAAEDPVDILNSLPTVSELASNMFSQDPRQKITDVQPDTIVELPSTLSETSLPPLMAEGTVPVQAAGRVKEPRLTSKAPVVYPDEARLNGIEGDVLINVVIDSNGKPTSLRVVAGPALLQAAALDSLRKWHYEPGYFDDKPVPVQKVISIEFRLH